MCPWHGRRIAPLVTIKDEQLVKQNKNLPYRVTIDGEVLEISLKTDT